VSWLQTLKEEAINIAEHGEGKLEFTVGPNGKKTLVLITAGRRHRFLIDKDLDDE